MPSNRKKARRAIRAFLKNLSEKNPDTPTDQQGVWACGAALYSEDLRTLLDSERAARRAAAVQSRKAAEAAQAAQRNQDAYLRERERTERLRRGNVPLATQPDAASVPDLRRLVEERGRKIRELTAERDREREHATRLAKKLDTLRAAPGTVNYQELYNELLPKAKRAEDQIRTQAGTIEQQDRKVRALAAERDSLKRALSNLRESVRKDKPRTYADILREARGLMQEVAESLKDEKK